MKKCCHSLFLLVFLLPVQLMAQAMLPEFTVKELTRGKIQISWNNPYPNCIQLAIQRSTDSSKNFRTLFSSQSPELVSNGYVDSKPLAAPKTWYRIFYAIQGGAYFFTKAIGIESRFTSSAPAAITGITGVQIIAPDEKDLTVIYFEKKPLFRLNEKEYLRFRDSVNTHTKDRLHRINEHWVEWAPEKKQTGANSIDIYFRDSLLTTVNRKDWIRYKDSILTKTKDTLVAITDNRVQLQRYTVPAGSAIAVYRNDSLLITLDPLQYKRFRDSVSMSTRDTIFIRSNQYVEIHSYVPRYIWKPSAYIFTNSKGYVTIRIPDIRQHRYHVIFYEEDGTELFRIKHLKEAELVLDKTDFVHAGWFLFELFEDDRLKEKNRFLLTRD